MQIQLDSLMFNCCLTLHVYVCKLQQFFEFGDYVNDPIIKAAVDVKCQKLYRDWKCELHTHYLSLLEEGVPDPKSHPLKPCKADDWAWMIDNLWETMEWKLTFNGFVYISASIIDQDHCIS